VACHLAKDDLQDNLELDEKSGQFNIKTLYYLELDGKSYFFLLLVLYYKL
jgi:hypothetical protein